MGLFGKSAAKKGRVRSRLGLGGQSIAPYAYHASRVEQSPHKSRRVGLKRSLRRLSLALLVPILVACLLVALNLSPNSLIKPMDGGTAAYLRPLSDYQAAANKLLSRSLWNRNKLTINTASIQQALEKKFPELSSVSVTLPLLSQKPVIYVAAARPSLLLITNNGSFVIDDRGKALFTSNSISSFTKLNLPLVMDQSGLSVNLNDQVLTRQNVVFIDEVSGELLARHYGVSSMVLPPNSNELDAHIGSQSYFVKFNMQSTDARQQAGTFLATINQLHKQNITPGQYVDVRVDGRAYYK